MSVTRHLRQALSSLRRTPTFTMSAVATLALGVGLATAVFTVANALLLRALPVREQERLVVLWGARRDGQMDALPLLLDEAREYAAAARAITGVAFISRHGATPVSVREGSSLLQMRRSLVSGGYFDLLGARPTIGRSLRPSDDEIGAAPVAVLSHGAWLRYFGGDSLAVGRRLTLHETGTAVTVVGVMPPGLDYPRGVDFWTAVVPSSGPVGTIPVYAELHMIGRLRPASTPADAETELTRWFSRAEANDWQRSLRGVAHPLPDRMFGDVKPAVLAFLAAAGLLLLITCINVAGLLMLRGLGRAREVAVWLALGAPLRHVLARLVTESALLSVAGGVLGSALSVAAVRVFLIFAPRELPRLDEVGVHGAAIVTAATITTVVTLLFAVVPAVFTTRVNLLDVLGARGPTSEGGSAMRRATQGLVVGQVALAVMVLSAAGVITRSLQRLEQVDLALEPAHVVIADLSLPEKNKVGFDNRPLIDALLARLSVVPGVRSVSPMLMLPFKGAGFEGQPVAAGQTTDDQPRNPILDIEVVGPDYFATLGIRIRQGRAFAATDREGAPAVAILSERAARHFWPGLDPIGQRLAMGVGGRELTVIGVVPETRYRDLRVPHPGIYFPLAQATFPVTPTTFAIRLDSTQVEVVPSIRRALQEVDARVALASIAPFEALLDEPTAQPRLNALLLSVFAIAALALATLGLFVVMTTMVRRRRHEFGVRMALGARAVDVLDLVMRQGLAIAALGTAAGLLGAATTNRLLSALLFEVSPTDGRTLSLVAIVLLMVAVTASVIPAVTAARTDAMRALRSE